MTATTDSGSEVDPRQIGFSARPIRVLLVDDHAVLLDALREFLKSTPDLEVIGEATSGEAAVHWSTLQRPDVVVMDVAMQGMGGVEATMRILAASPETKIVVLTAHEEATYARTLFHAGAAGYVLKRSACDELVRAIRAVSAGDVYVDPVLGEALSPRGRRYRTGTAPAALLSARELEVVRFVAQGYTAKEIAERTELSPRTLETYRARAMGKLELKSRADLVRYAARCGWLLNSNE